MSGPVRVTDYSVVGNGIGRTGEGSVIQIRGAVPGDLVMVGESVRRGHYSEASLIEILEPSPGRRDHPCPHHRQGCQGCVLGGFDSEMGLEWKRNHLRESLKRLGGIEIEVGPVVRSLMEWGYRERVELSLEMAAGRIRAGYHSPDGLIPIDDCLLGEEPVRAAIRQFTSELGRLESSSLPGSSFGDPVSIGRAIFRSNGAGAAIVILLLPPRFRRLVSLFRRILSRCRTAGWQIRMAENYADKQSPSESVAKEGDTKIYLSRGGEHSEADYRIFKQVNPGVAELLKNEVADYCGQFAKVLDLFGGWGMFGLEVASRGAEVLVVEVFSESLKAGWKLAKMAGITVKFLKANLSKPEGWESLPAEFDAAIVDPVKRGLSRSAIEWLNARGPENLIYVSCHPAGLARDLKQLNRYRLDRVRPFDMFPQTPDLETVAILTRLKDEEWLGLYEESQSAGVVELGQG